MVRVLAVHQMGGPDHKVKGIRIDTVREYPFQMGLQPGFNADADGECALKVTSLAYKPALENTGIIVFI